MVNPEKIAHRQVGPRDGEQFEDVMVGVRENLLYIDKLIGSGEKFIEITSFASKAAVPNMAEAVELATAIKERVQQGHYKDVTFSVLIMSDKFLDEALKIVDKDFGELAVVTAASDKFCQKNMRIANVQASVDAAGKIIEKANERGVKVRGYISTIFKGPSEKTPEGVVEGDTVNPEIVANVAKQLLDKGCYEISLGDTTGAGTPEKVVALMDALKANGVAADKTAAHFHDTGGQAINNIQAYYDAGGRAIDSASGGLGQCKFSGDPKGNVATENVLKWAEDNGIETGIDMKKAVEASHYILNQVGRPSPSFIHNQVAREMNLPAIKPIKVNDVRVKPDGSYNYKHLNVAIDERGVGQIEMNRPKMGNAFNPEMIAEITDVFSKMGKDDKVKVIVLSGAGKNFSAGADLNWMGDMVNYTKDENFQDAMKLADMLKTMRWTPKPVIARIQGGVKGGGCGLTAVCDYAVAAQGTVFAFSEKNLGLRPSTISPYCIEKMGKKNAEVLFNTAQDFYAKDARNIGLIADVVPHNILDQQIEMAVNFALKEYDKNKHPDEVKYNLRDLFRKDRVSVIGDPETVAKDEKMTALINNVSRISFTDWRDVKPPANINTIMEYTASDIADARTSDEGQEGIKKFLEGTKKVKGA